MSYLKILKLGLLPILSQDTLRVSSIYIKDAVRAMLRFLHPPQRSGEIYHIADSPPLDLTEVSRKTAAFLGRTCIPVRISRKAAHFFLLLAGQAARFAGARPSLNRNFYLELIHGDWAVDIRKAAEELPFRAETPLAEALAETLDWYKRKGWL